MNKPTVDLFSDTKTRPSQNMMIAMMEAETGDEQANEDPTTRKLQERVAELLGKEDALFLPSGTMCNQIAIAVHCRPGDEIIADKTSHIINFEAGGAAVIGQAMIKSLEGERGIFTVEQVNRALRSEFRHSPSSKMIAIEQTANLGGGSIWPLETLVALQSVAKENNLITHMDGARLLNAVVASGVSAIDYAATAETVWIDLSKGLGCPVGGVIAGSKEFIQEAWPWKQRLGGSMRQSGILAAAGLYALDNNVDRLAVDHENAKTLATELSRIPGVKLDSELVETNIILIDVGGSKFSAPEISERLLADGVRIGAFSSTRMRAVTHLDIDGKDVDVAVKSFQKILA